MTGPDLSEINFHFIPHSKFRISNFPKRFPTIFSGFAFGKYFPKAVCQNDGPLNDGLLNITCLIFISFRIPNSAFGI